MAEPKPAPEANATGSTGSVESPLGGSLEKIVSGEVIVIGKPIHQAGDESPLFRDYESRQSLSDEQPFEDRDTWANKLEFIMACLSMSVGLGNVWRFPFTVLENGGGAFLIPYFIFLFGIGKPISVVDMSLGQFSSSGPVSIWNMVPFMKGVGYCTLVIAGSTLTYVCAILAFCAVYLFKGLSSSLPWATCDTSLYMKREYIENLTCQFDSILKTNVANVSTIKYYRSNSELYFHYSVAKQLEHIDDGIGLPDTQLVLALALVWILMFVQFAAGTKSTGKVAYFTACFPHVVLTTLLIRAVLLDGAVDGIIFFFKPDWNALFTFQVWRNALGQAFFSLAVGYGTMIYGSYNPFRQHIKIEAMIVGFADGFTSLLAGVTVFAVLGVLAHRKSIPIENLAQGDMGLAFVTYPEVLSYFGSFPMPQIFSFIFFAMLLSLGVGSSAGYLHPIVATLYDLNPSLAKSRGRKVCLTVVICVLGFLLGLVYTTPGGIFMIHLVDEFLTGLVVYIIVCCELIGVFWLYGVDNYIQDMEFMLNAKCPSIYRVWCYFIPFFMLAVAVTNTITFESPHVHVNYEPVLFPDAALNWGYLMVIVTVSLIPIGGIVVICTRKTRSCTKKFKASFNPNRKWGPKNPTIRKEWEAYKKSLYHKVKNPPSLYKITIGRLRGRKAGAEASTETLAEEDNVDILGTNNFIGSDLSVTAIAELTAVVGTVSSAPDGGTNARKAKIS